MADETDAGGVPPVGDAVALRGRLPGRPHRGAAGRTDQHHRPRGATEPTEQDLAIATLVGRYIQRREHHETPRVHDLLAVAAEFGSTAVGALRTVLAGYEAMRAVGNESVRLPP